MASARDAIDRSQLKPRPKIFKRAGSVTQVEKNFVAQFVADQPREITNGQTLALSKVMRRSTDAVREMIKDAREELTVAGLDYVRMHKQAVEQALANNDPKSLAVATQASEWAMENIAVEGVRIVDKIKESSGGGIKIAIGVKVGGVNDQADGAVAPAVVGVVIKSEETQ